jgi:hypothetical protein
LIIAASVLALLPWAGGVRADPHPEPTLMPPVNPACISSPFRPRVLTSHPRAATYHYGIDLLEPPGASIVARPLR